MDSRHSLPLALNAGYAPFMQLGQPTNNPVQLPEDAALRKIAEGIKSETGERFFSSLVRHLALVLNCQYAFVSELSKDRLRFRTRAVWGRGQFLANFDVPVAGTPCEAVLNGNTAHYPPRSSGCGLKRRLKKTKAPPALESELLMDSSPPARLSKCDW